MYTLSDVVTFGYVVALFIGAALNVACLLWLRMRYGIRRSRTVGAILIDAGFTFCAVVFVVGGLIIIRTVYGSDSVWWSNLIRFTLLTGFAVAIWSTAIRLAINIVLGDGEDQAGVIPQGSA